MSNPKYPNSGTLGRNERMRPDHKDPEYTGQMNLDGKDYWLSAWVKDGRDGKKFFSISVKPKDAQPEPKAELPPGTPEDDVPF